MTFLGEKLLFCKFSVIILEKIKNSKKALSVAQILLLF